MNTSHAVRERVLLVDDEPQVLVALEDLLCEEFVVLKSESARAALDVFERERDIAVVITDQRMPKMNGDELLAKLGHSSDAARILVTGYADLSAVIRAVNDGRIFAYVTKPWDPNDLRLKVNRAAQHFRLGKALAHERQLLHDLMDSIPDGIYFKDSELRFQTANRAFAAMLDVPDPDLLVGRSIGEIAGPADDVERYEREELGIIADGLPVVDVLRPYRRTDGREHWYSETKAPIRSFGSEVIGIVGISRDVTERVAMSDALSASEERFREQSGVLHSILDSMADGVVVADQEGRVLLFNRQAERLLGTSAPSSSPLDWAAAFGMSLVEPNAALPPEQNPLLRAMREERTVHLEVLVQNAAVPNATLTITATPLRAPDGSLKGAVALLLDVTQQRRLEEQLTQSQKMDAIGQLAGGVAHDFNNLLSVIQSYAQLLLGGFENEDPRRDDVLQVLAASQRAGALTRQLLAFCRRQVVQPKILQLNEVVAEIDKMLRRVIGEDIELLLTLSPALGLIKADPSQIEQIILNLAVNSRDAMPRGGKLVIETADVSVDRAESEARGIAPGEFVMLAISDTGVGMDAATQKRIFEPFFTTKEVGKGTGLGLSTVYGIVQQTNAHVSVSSEVGRGTSFTILFPRVEGVPRQPNSLQPVPAKSKAGTILLVEDEVSVRQIATRILRARGYTVLEAGRASEARAIFAERSEALDLLLIDVVMPETTGPTLAAEFVRACPRLRVVFMSGYPGTAIVQGGLIEGASYLEKPFTPASLAEKVRAALEAPPS